MLMKLKPYYQEVTPEIIMLLLMIYVEVDQMLILLLSNQSLNSVISLKLPQSNQKLVQSTEVST